MARMNSTTRREDITDNKTRGGTGGAGGGGRSAARFLALFSALCVGLLWVGVASLSRSQVPTGAAGYNSSTRRMPAERKAAASALGSVGEAGAIPTTNKDASVSRRNLSRRPELKTRGGQLAFARFSLLAEYPHDETAFTQGLSFKDGYLFESTGLLGGKSSLRQVEPETGEVVQSVNLGHEYFGEGMVIFGDEIHSLTWRSRVGFTWDLETFEKKNEFSFKTDTGQGWGITTDETSLIVSDGSQYLYFWDPKTMEETRRVEAKHGDGRLLKRINELEFVNGYIFANVWFDDNLYKIDPVTGEVVDTYNLTELYPKALRKQELTSREAVLNGIAWDPEEDVLYLTGKLWPRMYKIRLHEEEVNMPGGNWEEGASPPGGGGGGRQRQ